MSLTWQAIPARKSKDGCQQKRPGLWADLAPTDMGGLANSISTDKAHGGVTLENIFEKYFIRNALQKHRGHAHRCLTMCVLVVII